LSDPKNISPLLDGFTLGAPISEHHGVICCPAIKENTNKKYIVKIISVPASQSQFDAMLLAGAYKDPGDAMEYFRENGERILEEAELLKTLSKIEGFLPYDGWQMEPITRRRLGYEIYLVGSYKRSLEKYIRKNALTHLEAINFGLDLCAALSVCRQSGFLYADLKPSNVYVSERKEFRIGDLGFLSLNSLRYASLPERYFSPYTPPELLDPMAPMNLTVDTYALGMILYQLYNDGHLPFTGLTPTESLPTPCHADYEMAEIIMKAIHQDPEQRWTDPKDLGKAIASYMQRNSVNDIPITPFIPLDVNPEDIVVIRETEAPAEQMQEVPVCEDPTSTEVVSVDEESENMTDSPDDVQELPDEVSASGDVPVPQNSDDLDDAENVNSEVNVDESTISTEESEAAESEPLSEIRENLPAEEAPEPESVESDTPDLELSEEVAKIISRADDIISHEIPLDTAFPAEVELPDPFAFAREDSEDIEVHFYADPFVAEEEEDPAPDRKKKSKHFENPSRKRIIRKFISGCISLLLLVGLSVGGFWYYQNVYLQTIDTMSISGTQDEITVLIDTAIDESTLTVYCMDDNGKRLSEPVQGGKVVFSGLKPSTQYSIQIDMRGFHKLVGNTSDKFTTDATTQIVSFQAVAGSENGSVLLDFTVDGHEPDFWNIRYWSEGEEERLETVTSHSTMVTGLTVGKVYTFTLDGGKNFDLGGETSLRYLASRLILAENLAVTSSDGSDISISWKTPGDVVVESWNVRIHDGYGFEEQLTVTENTAMFSGIDPASHYTVEVTAAGMTQPSRIEISADPINLSDFLIDEEAKTEINLSWVYSGIDPEGGWILKYTVDGSGYQEIPCEKASAVISPLVPGANYKFMLEAADGRTVFNNTVLHTAKDAEKFTEFNFHLDDISADVLETPDDPNWSYETITEDLFTTDFHVGDPASIVLRSTSTFYLPGNKVKLLFVFRDSYGNVLPELIMEESCSWKDIWMGGDSKIGEIDIPVMPTIPGEYQMDLYVNGCTMAAFDVTIAN